MGETKDINIKNRTYYYFDDMIDIKKFEPNLLKIDKKSHRDIDIYYIGYITIKNFNTYKNINSVNPLYLIILDPIEKYEEVFSGIKSEIKTINSGEKMYYKTNYPRIRVNADDDVPLNKQLKFLTLTIIIRCFFQKGKELCPQIYLDECLYQL